MYLLLSGSEVTRGELIRAFQKQPTIDLTIADELLKVMGAGTRGGQITRLTKSDEL
ncbi:hypothetical protein UF75_0747 [Desulfosporosinus sp. I2]|uniref:hypothetical protein n=1 Tax=Desulfosporosinus sp. I2 TaxID=1617025 RepID=UPI00061FB430|nr:hypothetical protein [Desulfosporosinus sp. I2]KJR48860.1 hypothetical protein UF75_0747 [Desulfosporosinus sp. I2]